MVNPALGQVPGSVGRPRVVLVVQHSRMIPLGIIFKLRLQGSSEPLLLRFLQMSSLQTPAPSGAMDLLSCLRVFVGFEPLTLLSAFGTGRFLCQTSPLPGIAELERVCWEQLRDTPCFLIYLR